MKGHRLVFSLMNLTCFLLCKHVNKGRETVPNDEYLRYRPYGEHFQLPIHFGVFECIEN